MKYIKNFNSKKEKNLGSFLSENSDMLYKIDVIYLEISDNYNLDVEYGGKWFKCDELYKMNLDRIYREITKNANKSV